MTSRALCVSCTSDDERLDVRGLCRVCRDAYALGRKEALCEALASALRVRGSRRSGREVEDAHADGSYSASSAIASFLRVLLRRRYPKRP